jgi:hypothetical protein
MPNYSGQESLIFKRGKRSMGIFAQRLTSQRWETGDSALVPAHIRGLLNELLARYSEWQKIRRREASWLICVVILGFLCLTVSMLSFKTPIFVTLGLLAAFVVVLRKYLLVRKISTHTYVNVHILHHHLLGKLEVGFCQHDSACQCAENFRKHVWRKYRISLYGNGFN